MISAVKRSTGFAQVRLARSSRAKTECGADAGRRNGSAIAPTEDKAARRFAAARTAPGSTERTRAILPSFTAQNGKTYDTEPVVTNSCKKAKKYKKSSHGEGKHSKRASHRLGSSHR
jgi:hypothetical protein